jgi:tetratricopeptide (TPR) repeat protein
MYYVLARIYRSGFEKLGKDDLAKAEIILKKGLNYSDLRMEYFNDLSYVLLLQGKFEEGEKLLQAYVERVDFYDYFPYLTLGHFYFEAKKYDLAMEQYEKAREAGYDFCEVPAEYSRYMFSAEETKQYQRVVDMAKKYLERWGPEADTYFNIAVGYLNLNEKEKAKEFFLKAMELNPEYEQYQLFFVD